MNAVESLRAGDPDRVGGYRLVARLGAGGMGVVYLARSPAGRSVAVKVVHERFAADPEFRARFRREVTAARSVRGAFTAAVLDADPEAAAPWLVTAYLAGLSLREAVSGFGALPPATVRVLAAGFVEALADIHRVGLVHRDLKPGNVVLTATEPRVTDFGIARPADGTAITQVGAVIGTPGFMSPEQVAHEVAGPASDVFALGAVLVFAATGREPFGDGSTDEVLRRVRAVEVDLAGLTDPWLLELVTACLRVQPWQRPTAAELLARMTTAGEWLPVPLLEEIERRVQRLPDLPHTKPGPAVAGGETVVPQAIPAGRTTRRVVIGATLAAAVAGGTALLLRGRRENPTPPVAAPPLSETTTTTEVNRQPPVAVSRWKVKVSDYYPEVYAAGGVVVAKVEEQQVHGLDPLSGKVLWTLSSSLTGVVTGGRVYVAESANPKLTAVDPATGATLWAYPVPAREVPVSVVDNETTACYGYEQLRALSSAAGRTVWTASVSPKHGLAADAGVVAAVDTALVGLDPASGRTRWTVAVDGGSAPMVTDGLVLVGDAQGTLHAVRADTGAPAWQQPQFGSSYGIRSAGGTLYLATGSVVFALDAATGAVRWSRALTTTLPTGSTLGLAGGTILHGGSDKTVRALSSADGQVLWTYGADVSQRAGPVGVAGLVFIGTRDGYVEALAPPDGGPRAGS